MKDRTPTNPGRVQLTPVSGNIYDLTMADDPTEIGTPLNKATLLKDATAALYNLGVTAVPDDVLSIIGTHLNTNAAKIESGSYTGTGTYGNANRSTLTFTFNPEIVFVNRAGGSNNNADMGVFREGCSYAAEFSMNASSGSSRGIVIDTFANGTLTWHQTSSASNQLNESNTEYMYIAIGKVGN